MAKSDTSSSSFGAELTALGTVLKALERLEPDQRVFVLRTVVDRLNINSAAVGLAGSGADQGHGQGHA